MRKSGNVGLFRSTTSGATIKQIGIEDAHVYGNPGRDGSIQVGTLVGYNEGWIAASHAIKTNNGASLVRAGAATAFSKVGGLVGWNQVEGKIIASYTQEIAVNDISRTRAHGNLGGLVGWNNGWIIACYAVANVSSGQSSTRLGGLVGRNTYTLARSGFVGGSGFIRASYAKGTVTRKRSGNGFLLGGLVGSAHHADLRASYANANVISEVQGSDDLIGRVIGGPFVNIDGFAPSGRQQFTFGLAITFNYGFGTKMGSNGSTFPVPISTSPDWDCGEDFKFRTGVDRENCKNQPLDGVPPRSCGSGGTDRCTIHTLSLAALTAFDAAAGTQWNSASHATLGAWDFGGTGPNSPPKLRYNDYDGSGGINDHHGHTFNIDCNLFPEGACDNGGTLIPGQ